jgi:hypothetical protein
LPNARNPQRDDDVRLLDPACGCGRSRRRQHARKDTVTAPNGSESSNPVKPKLRSALSD